MTARLILLFIISQLISACSDNDPSPAPAPETGTEAISATEGSLEGKTKKGGICAPLNGITPYCGFKNPEDLVILPGGDKLLVSEMGEFMMDTPGRLSLLDLTSGKKEAIKIDWSAKEQTWGDKDCPKPKAFIFSPHGIDLTILDSGPHQLLVVNHGGRESVEFFSLTQQLNQWQLEWKGCALPPGDPFINDVAGLMDGGFLVTHMWDKSLPFETVAEKLTAGESTGWVWAWQAGKGFSKLPGSTELMPNGITVSHDNKHVFINIYMANKTIKLDRATGKKLGEFAVQQPDNITLDRAGKLWVASHKHDPINQNCNDVQRGPCLLPFDIVKADSRTMQAEVVLSHDGVPMGYSTVALKVGNKIFMGSAHGDRVASFPLPE